MKLMYPTLKAFLTVCKTPPGKPVEEEGDQDAG